MALVPGRVLFASSLNSSRRREEHLEEPGIRLKGITMQKRSFRNGRLSEQVLHEMQRLITEEYPEPGSRLPKETELAERFQVSRIVVREAMKILEDRGVVEVRAGRGTL